MLLVFFDGLNLDMVVKMSTLFFWLSLGTDFITTLCAKFVGSNPSDKPQENLEIWEVKTGRLIHAFLQKKQHDW